MKLLYGLIALGTVFVGACILFWLIKKYGSGSGSMSMLSQSRLEMHMLENTPARDAKLLHLGRSIAFLEMARKFEGITADEFASHQAEITAKSGVIL